LRHSKNKVTSDTAFKDNHLYFIRFIRLFKNSLYLCSENKNITIMTAIELRAELLREISPLLDNESAMTKLLKYVRMLVPAKKVKTETGWADRFVGAWKDDRSADEIVSDIRSARTVNRIDEEL
jgi:hypothetical protein